MNERNQSRLASVLTLLVGIWVAISPIWLPMQGGAVASAIITGSVIALFSIIQYFWANTFPSWIMGLAAIWMFISSFFFGTSGGAQLSLILSAIATFILSYWDGFEVAETNRHHMATG